jgi:hypothetical protein
MTRRQFALSVLLAPLAARTAAAQDSGFGGGRPEERYFGVEAELGTSRRGPVAEGYVTNRYNQYADRVVLTLIPIDAAGQPLAPVTAYVNGVPPRNRTYFRTPVPPGATAIRASVAYYEWAPRGGGM